MAAVQNKSAEENGQTANRKRKLRGRARVSQQRGIYSNKWMIKVYEEKPPFPEELFQTQFAQKKLEIIVAALKIASEKEVDESPRLLEDDYTYSLQVTCHKIPNVNVHLTRVTLKHSLLNDDSEIAIFVKDLQRGRRVDHEPTIQHYENLFKEKNINHKLTIIPINQLYNEYSTFEARRKLSFLYDKFLVDRSVAAHVNGFLGSKMLKKGCLAIPVNMNKENLNDEIDKALRQVIYKHNNRGVLLSIKVGKHIMSNDKIAENIIDLLRQFGNVHPGGYKNVHKLHLRPQTNLAISIPIYISVDKPLDSVPVDKSQTDVVVDQQITKAEESLENFDLTAAAKLVRKRFPIGQIISDEILMTEDEAEPEIKKLKFIAGEPIESEMKPTENTQAIAASPPAAIVVNKLNDSVSKPVNDATVSAPIVNVAKNKNRRGGRQRNGKPTGGIKPANNDNINQNNSYKNSSFDASVGASNDFTRRPNRNGSNNSYKEVGNNLRDNFNRLLETYDRGDNYNRNGDNFGRGGNNYNNNRSNDFGRNNDGSGNNDNLSRYFGNNSFNSSGGGRFNSRF